MCSLFGFFNLMAKKFPDGENTEFTKSNVNSLEGQYERFS